VQHANLPFGCFLFSDLVSAQHFEFVQYSDHLGACTAHGVPFRLKLAHMLCGAVATR
jgi:hypothetical protein